MPFFSFKSKHTDSKYRPSDAPPEWTPAPEHTHTLGLYSEATENDYESAEQFCNTYPVEGAKLLPSYVVDRINSEGCKAWKLQWPATRFVGEIKDSGEKGGDSTILVKTKKECKDVCILSDLPLMAGRYDIQGKLGVYYEVKIHKMKGIIAIGTACKPYPEWRFPGWNRLSAGLHLDDMRKFFEDPNGGRDYTPELTEVSEDDIIGCGYDFTRCSIFYTYNGRRLPDAFTGVYVPRTNLDVYAAIGVEGKCKFEVNFGGELFKWKEGNEWSWRVEGHVGRLSGGPSGENDELPTYQEVRRGY